MNEKLGLVGIKVSKLGIVLCREGIKRFNMTLIGSILREVYVRGWVPFFTVVLPETRRVEGTPVVGIKSL